MAKVVRIEWDEKYAMPIFVLDNGERYRPSTGEYAGYFQEVERDDVKVEDKLPKDESRFRSQ